MTQQFEAWNIVKGNFLTTATHLLHFSGWQSSFKQLFLVFWLRQSPPLKTFLSKRVSELIETFNKKVFYFNVLIAFVQRDLIGIGMIRKVTCLNFRQSQKVILIKRNWLFLAKIIIKVTIWCSTDSSNVLAWLTPL